MSRQNAVLKKRSLPSPRLRSDKSASHMGAIHFFISIGIYFISLCVISLASSYFLNMQADPQKYIHITSTVSAALSSAIAAGYLCRATEKSPLACGIIMSVIAVGIAVVLSLIFKGYATVPIYKGLLLKIPLLFSSFLGAAIGKKRDRRVRCCGR